MADFCAPCTETVFGPDLPNDLARDESGEHVELCEGCGWHLFDAAGQPLCGHSGWGTETPLAFPDLCETCVEVAVVGGADD